MALTRRALGPLAAALAIPGIARAHGAWPERRLRIIVPYTAGGATDILARQVAERLGTILRQPVVVENRPGGGAIIGAVAAAQAEPDGYTLYMGQVATHGIVPAVHRNPRYDAVADFKPIMMLMSIPNLMVVPAAFPANTVAEFIAVGRSRPTNFASSGVGSSIHLSGELFKSLTKLDMTHVPYRGSSEAVTSVISGTTDVMFDNMPSALPHVRSGRLKGLGVTSTRRSAAAPEIPTIAESGVAELAQFEATAWFGLLTQAAVPDAIADRVHAALEQIMKDESFLAYIAQNGGTPGGGSRAEFAAHIARELAKWKQVVEDAGVPREG